MQLVIITPRGTLRDTAVERVALPGAMSPFMVLRGHAPLIAGLTAGEIVFTTTEGVEERLAVSGGVVRVQSDVVEACVELPQNTNA